MKKGVFITFEGGEGSGKTTQLALLGTYLREKGLSVLTTREPGGTPLGDQIRTLILNPSKTDTGIDVRTEFFLYLASRSQHVSKVIKPALDAGRIVLCDRFTDATLAYQGDGRGLPKKTIHEMAGFASYKLEPHLTFFLDIAPKKALSRLSGRNEINRLDEETLVFHQAVYQGYLKLARENPGRITVISGEGPVESISLKIQERINALLS